MGKTKEEKVAAEAVEEKVVEQEEVKAEAEAPKIVAMISVGVDEQGKFHLSVPEESVQLSSVQVENVLRDVSEMLRESRIAANAVEMFKQKLG